MIAAKCPGQDTRYWKAEDIHEQPCPFCGESIEFWKTDIRVRCPQCRQKVANPRFNLGCAQWCAFADKCLGDAARGVAPESLRQILDRELTALTRGFPREMKILQEMFSRAEERCREEGQLLLPVLLALLSLGAADLGLVEEPQAYLEQVLVKHDFPAEAAAAARSVTASLAQGLAREGAELLVAALRDKNVS